MTKVSSNTYFSSKFLKKINNLGIKVRFSIIDQIATFVRREDDKLHEVQIDCVEHSEMAILNALVSVFKDR